MDLRSTIRAVSRLPFEADRLVEILRSTEPTAAEDSLNEDHTTFWLVIADQFAKRGIDSSPVRDKAIDIIDRGTDLALLEKLGMTQRDLRKRRKVLDDLRASLLLPAVTKSRPTLRKPQPLLMDIGDVLIYPTSRGQSLNPYDHSRKLQRDWQQDGWGAITIIDRGLAFDFLAWYRPLTILSGIAERPTLASLSGAMIWRLERAGTCSAVHFKRIGFEKIGTFQIDEIKLRSEFPGMRPGISAAVNDISIGNALSVTPSFNPRFAAMPGERPKKSGLAATIGSIATILS